MAIDLEEGFVELLFWLDFAAGFDSCLEDLPAAFFCAALGASLSPARASETKAGSATIRAASRQSKPSLRQQKKRDGMREA